jgi:hypothetical protein
MTWCDATLVSTLIHTVCSEMNAERRAAADQQVRSLRADGVNYGDVLAEIVCSHAQVPMEVRFAAAMQLEGMATKGGWDEARNFSDKPSITKQLIDFIAVTNIEGHSLWSQHAYYQRLMLTVVRCVAQMCSLEYSTMNSPTAPGGTGGVWSPWEGYLEESLHTALHGDTAAPHTKNCRDLLQHAASLGRQNTMMWRVLANRGVQACLNALQQLFAMRGPDAGDITYLSTTSSSCDESVNVRTRGVVEFCIKFASTLASKPPIDPQVFQSTLFGAEFMQWMTHTTQTYVGLEALWPVQDEAVVLAGCELSIQCLTFMIHTPKREATHRPLLTSLIRTLTTMGESYLLVVSSLAESSKRGEALHALITEMLESIQAVLDAIGTAFDWVDISQLFGALLWFMVDDEAVEDSTTAEEILVAAMEADDTVLAGCGSGSPRAVATSLVQLFIDNDADAVFDFVEAWAAMAAQLGTTGGTMYWSALCSVLIAMAHQVEMSNTSLHDTLGEGATAKIIAPTIARIAHEGTTPLLRGRLLYALGCIMAQSEDVEACSRIFHYLVQVISAESQRTGGGVASMAACVALHAACSILTTTPPVCTYLVGVMPPTMMDCALWVASSSGSLGSYCGGFAISKLIDVADHLAVRMWSSGRIASAVEGIVAHCTTGTKGNALSTLLVSLIEEHVTVVEPSQGAAPSAFVLTRRCDELQAVMSTIHQAATRDVASGVVMRCLFEALPTMLQWFCSKRTGLAEAAAQCGSSLPSDWCTCQAMMATIAKTVSTFASSHGPHDDATLRALFVSLGNTMASEGIADQEIAHVAVQLFQECAPEASSPSSTTTGAVITYNSLTVTNAALCLAVAAMHQKQPSFVSVDALRSFFTGVSLCKGKWKDAHNTGICLYPAICATFNPNGSLLPLLLTSSTSPPHPAATDILGLWVSTISFADRRTQLYTLIAWHRLLQCVFLSDIASTDAARHFATSATTNCTFRKLKGLHEKTSKLTIHNCSPLQAILYGLSDVCYSNVRMFAKLTNFTHHTIFDALLSPNRQENVHGDAFCAELLQCTSSEGALKILQFWGDAVLDMRPMISAAGTAITSI